MALTETEQEPVTWDAFFDVLDKAIPRDKLQSEFPTLSPEQIEGAIQFLRLVAPAISDFYSQPQEDEEAVCP